MTLGEPYAGKPPVRFDEGRRCETGTDNHDQFNPAVTPRLLYWQAGRSRAWGILDAVQYSWAALAVWETTVP